MQETSKCRKPGGVQSQWSHSQGDEVALQPGLRCWSSLLVSYFSLFLISLYFCVALSPFRGEVAVPNVLPLLKNLPLNPVSVPNAHQPD